jgi:hypothetical protein
MSTGLIEVESHAWHFHCATGNVLLAGLGMGMYLHAASMKPDVKRIVVIERDPDVIALMKETADFERWIHRDKITIIEADAMGEGTGDKVAAAFNDECPDYLYADIWPVFPAPEAPAQTKKMVDLYRPRKAGWWGQEVEFGLWLDDRGRGASLDTLREFFDANGVDASIHDGYLAFCEDTISIQLGDGLERGPFAASAPYGP